MFGVLQADTSARAGTALMRPCGESMKTLMFFLPRIAYSAAEPVSPEVAPRMLRFCFFLQHGFEQIAEQLQRHVLERERRPVRQAEQVQAGLERLQRRDVVAAEDFLRVGALDDAPSGPGTSSMNCDRIAKASSG